MAATAVQVEVPSLEDRDVTLYCLRRCDDAEVSQTIVPSLWGHFEEISRWATACDPAMLAAPAAFYGKKLVLITAMSDDAAAFLSRGVPHAVCEADAEAVVIGRVAAAAKWICMFCANAALLATVDVKFQAPERRQQVQGRYAEVSKSCGYYLSASERYTYNPDAVRNCLNPEHIDGLRSSVDAAGQEAARLEAVGHMLHPSSSSHPPSPLDPLLFDPPLAQFAVLRDIGHWAYSLACRDFHERLLRNQQQVFAGLRARLAQVKRAVPSMRAVFSEDQRREVFEAVDQVHYDATQLVRHLEGSLQQVDRRIAATQGAAGKASWLGNRSTSADSTTVAPPESSSSLWNVLCCRPEITHTEVVALSSGGPAHSPRGPSAAAGESHRQKTAQLVTLTQRMVQEARSLQQHMDRNFPDEYASGIGVRASRAATRLLQWVQSATVVFGPPAAGGSRALVHQQQTEPMVAIATPVSRHANPASAV